MDREQSEDLGGSAPLLAMLQDAVNVLVSVAVAQGFFLLIHDFKQRLASTFRWAVMPLNGYGCGFPPTTSVRLAHGRGHAKGVAGKDIRGIGCRSGDFDKLSRRKGSNRHFLHQGHFLLRGGIGDFGGCAELPLTVGDGAMEVFKAVVADPSEAHGVPVGGKVLDGDVGWGVNMGELGGIEKLRDLGTAILTVDTATSATMLEGVT
jgi:hypothetical protein